MPLISHWLYPLFTQLPPTAKLPPSKLRKPPKHKYWYWVPRGPRCHWDSYHADWGLSSSYLAPKIQGQESCLWGPKVCLWDLWGPPASQMVANQPLAATLWVKRGYRARKVDTKTQTTKSQTQVDQRIQAKMDTSQTHISALGTQVAASVQALADDYLAQFSLEPTTRTRGKRNQKVRSLTSPPSLCTSFPLLSSWFVHLFYKSLLSLYTLSQSLHSHRLWEILRRLGCSYCSLAVHRLVWI